MTVEQKSFESFGNDYEVTMTKFRMHRFKYLILGKRFCGDVRKESLRHGECAWEHDFAEALSLKQSGNVYIVPSSLTKGKEQSKPEKI